MKLETLIIIVLFAADSAMAQNLATVEQANASQPQADQYLQRADAVPRERSGIELNARAAGMDVTKDSNRYSHRERLDDTDAGVIESWSDRVFRRLELHAQPNRFDLMQDNRMLSNTAMDALANEERVVTKIILRETLKYTQEQLPEIDVLIRALKLEVSTDMISRQGEEKEAVDSPAKPARTVRHAPVEGRFFLKTGLRIPVDGGKVGVVMETEATYGSLSSFLKVRLDGRYDSAAGLVYVLSRDVRVQVDRRVTHGTVIGRGDSASTKSSLNLVQLVCNF